MATKSFKLRAFEIENNFIDKKSSEILKALFERLKSTVLNERRMVLNSNDSEEDLICDYDLEKSNQIWGAMLRISPSENILSCLLYTSRCV